jgi:hypothetical protein
MNGYNTTAIGADRPIMPAHISAERGNAGKRLERPDGDIRHKAVSFNGAAYLCYYAGAHKAINPIINMC